MSATEEIDMDRHSDVSSIHSHHSSDGEPSYMIVQKQLRDVILSQNSAVAELVHDNVSK